MVLPSSDCLQRSPEHWVSGADGHCHCLRTPFKWCPQKVVPAACLRCLFGIKASGTCKHCCMRTPFKLCFSSSTHPWQSPEHQVSSVARHHSLRIASFKRRSQEVVPTFPHPPLPLPWRGHHLTCSAGSRAAGERVGGRGAPQEPHQVLHSRWLPKSPLWAQ